MANSCGGADASVPAEIEVAIKDYLRRHPKQGRTHFDHTDRNDDDSYSCLLEDLGGKRCPKGECCYNRDGKRTERYESKKPI